MRSFADLFKGRDDAYGWYGSVADAKPTDRGKLVSNAATRRGPVTAAMYQDHLNGEQRLGIVPVLRDGTCWWGCIDVDFYQEVGLHEDLAQRIKDCGLPLVMTKSKSGAPHLWCFFSDPVPAAEARKMMMAFKKKLKLPDDHVDIFPIQTKGSKNKDDVGNWMNIPYFGDNCHGLGPDGNNEQTLEEFVHYANSRIQHSSDLRVKAAEKAEARKSGAPPCIDYAKDNGVPDGYRNHFLFHMGVYLQKSNPDNWREELEKFNDEVIEEPLPHREMVPIIKSLGTEKYKAYLCEKVGGLFCDKRECRMREFGIGGGNLDDLIDIERIEKIDGEEPVYRITIDGKRFQVNVEQLFRYELFRRIAFGALDRFLPNCKQPEWEEFMKDRLAAMEVQKAASDTQTKERVIRIFEEFCEVATAESLKAAVDRKLPFYDGKDIIFRGDEFMVIVDRRLNKIPRNSIWAIMNDHGCILQDYTIDGLKLPFWKWIAEDRPLWFNPEKGEQV